MQLVLEGVLDLVLEIFRDIVPMRDVSDPSQGNTLHELVSEGRQVCLDAPHNEAVFFGKELLVQLLVELVSDASMVIRSVVALLATCDMSSSDEVKEG